MTNPIKRASLRRRVSWIVWAVNIALFATLLVFVFRTGL